MEPISRLVYDGFIPWQTYYIRVAREDGSVGDFSLQVDGSPTNDECVNAETVELDEYYDGTTYGATGSDDETTCGMGGMGDSHSVWYQYTASDNGTVVFQVQSWDECDLGIIRAC